MNLSGIKGDEFCVPGEAESLLMGEENTGQASALLFLFGVQIWKTGFSGYKFLLPGALHLFGSDLSSALGAPKKGQLISLFTGVFAGDC